MRPPPVWFRGWGGKSEISKHIPKPKANKAGKSMVWPHQDAFGLGWCDTALLPCTSLLKLPLPSLSSASHPLAWPDLLPKWQWLCLYPQGHVPWGTKTSGFLIIECLCGCTWTILLPREEDSISWDGFLYSEALRQRKGSSRSCSKGSVGP